MAKKKELPRNEAPTKDAQKASMKKKVDAMSSREKMDAATRTRNAAAKAGKIKKKKERLEYTPPRTKKKPAAKKSSSGSRKLTPPIVRDAIVSDSKRIKRLMKSFGVAIDKPKK